MDVKKWNNNNPRDNKNEKKDDEKNVFLDINQPNNILFIDKSLEKKNLSIEFNAINNNPLHKRLIKCQILMPGKKSYCVTDDEFNIIALLSNLVLKHEAVNFYIMSTMTKLHIDYRNLEHNEQINHFSISYENLSILGWQLSDNKVPITNYTSEILFQIFIIGYTLYRNGIDFNENIQFDIYKLPQNVKIGYSISNIYTIPINTLYIVLLNTDTKLKYNKELKPESYYVELLFKRFNLTASHQLISVHNKIHEKNFICILLFQFQFKSTQTIPNSNELSSINLNDYDMYRPGMIFEYMYNKIKANKCISLSSLDPINDKMYIYDVELGHVYIKNKDELRIPSIELSIDFTSDHVIKI